MLVLTENKGGGVKKFTQMRVKFGMVPLDCLVFNQ